MNISIKNFCEIMEFNEVPVLVRYKLLFAIKECCAGIHTLKWEYCLTPEDEDEMEIELKRLAEISSTIRNEIKHGHLSEPESLILH